MWKIEIKVRLHIIGLMSPQNYFICNNIYKDKNETLLDSKDFMVYIKTDIIFEHSIWYYLGT